jgi:tetratricopeptide (TPR) repeat protein
MLKKTILFLTLAACGLSFAQQVSGDSLVKLLEQAKNFYNGGEYEKAITELEQALQFLKQLNQLDQVEAYKYLAFSYVAFGDKEKAKEQFRLALKLDPKMELDPSVVSPKIIKVFEEVKSEFAAVTPPVTPPVKPPVKPPSTPPPAQPEKNPTLTTAMSCCLPGLGQMYRGEKAQGTTLMILGGVTLVSFFATQGIAAQKHEDYKAIGPEDPDAMDRAYKAYRIWYNAGALTGLAFAGVYLYNLYDVIFTKPPVRTSWGRADDGFYCGLEPDRLQAGYRLKF